MHSDKNITILGINYDIKTTTQIDLSSNKLTELPKEIEKLTSLTYLYLHNNKLTELPKEIGN
jgi:Leucine-rich repeat (LRR) protein